MYTPEEVGRSSDEGSRPILESQCLNTLEGQCPAQVVTELEERILRHLAPLTRRWRKAWDVPRSLTQRGIADALGLARSSLHHPLQSLQSKSFIDRQQAHILDVPGRKQAAFFLSEKGLAAAESAESSRLQSMIIGPTPDRTVLVGRDSALKDALDALENRPLLAIDGLAGIGISAVGRELAHRWSATGRNVRWATMSDGGLSALSQHWFPDLEPLGAADALIHRMSSRPSNESLTLYVIDDAFRLPPSLLSELCAAFTDRLRNQKLLILHRSPLDIEIPHIRLVELDDESARSLLPEDLPDTRLLHLLELAGGHPMALRLLSLADSAEASTLNEYVATELLAGLSTSASATLTEVSLGPHQTPIDLLVRCEGVDDLDARAVLKFTQEGTSVPAFIGSVHLTGVKREAEHANLAGHHYLAWQAGDHRPARRAQWFHHLVRSNPSNIETWLDQHGVALASSQPLVLTDMMQSLESLSPVVHRWVGEAYLELGALDAASSVVESLTDPSLRRSLELSLALHKGDLDRWQELMTSEEDSLDGRQKAVAVLRRWTRALEDRLPGMPNSLSAKQAELELGALKISHEDAPLMVAVASLRHALALETKDGELASGIRSALVRIAGASDPLVRELQLRSDLRFAEEGESTKTIVALRDLSEQVTSPLRSASLRLLLACNDQSPSSEEIRSILSLSKEMSGPARRLRASALYLLGVVDSTVRTESWLESRRLFILAGCPEASKLVGSRLVEEIR